MEEDNRREESTVLDARKSPSVFWKFLVGTVIGYSLLSIVTLPFLNSLWLGEVPVLAIFQSPKLPAAHWVRRNVVMKMISTLHLSRGSASPDFVMARPYALAIVYLVPLAILLGTLWGATRFARPYGRLTVALLAVVAVDFCFTLTFGSTRFLTVY